MIRVAVVLFVSMALVCMVVQRCRRCPDLCAHDEYMPWRDPYLDELVVIARGQR